MVKNSGQKSRAKQYAAKHGIPYQQAREALDRKRTAAMLDHFIEECGSRLDSPNDVIGNLPFGATEEGLMQWVLPTDDWESPVLLASPSFDPGADRPIEVVGGPGTGKTTLVSRMIAHRATEIPRPRSIRLYAGAREFDAACARWEGWPQVVVIGPEGQIGRTSANARDEDIPNTSGLQAARGHELRVFDDWFTGKSGLLPRYTRDEISHLPVDHPVRWRARIAATASVAAFRPGHVSHLDESGDIEGAISGVGGDFIRGNPEVFSRGFIARDEFVFDPAEDSDAPSSDIASLVLIPDGEVPYVWETRLDGRRLGLPIEVHTGPGRVMYGEVPNLVSEYQSPEKVSEFAAFVWEQRRSERVDVDFPYTSGPRNADVEQESGLFCHAFPSLDVAPLDMDAITSEEADEAVERAVQAYWAIGERGTEGA